MSSRFVRTSACPFLDIMISLLCQLGTSLRTAVRDKKEEVVLPAAAAYDGFCCRACVLLSTFEESCCTAS
jgi:hypothetical protein